MVQKTYILYSLYSAATGCTYYKYTGIYMYLPSIKKKMPSPDPFQHFNAAYWWIAGVGGKLACQMCVVCHVYTPRKSRSVYIRQCQACDFFLLGHSDFTTLKSQNGTWNEATNLVHSYHTYITKCTCTCFIMSILFLNNLLCIWVDQWLVFLVVSRHSPLQCGQTTIP